MSNKKDEDSENGMEKNDSEDTVISLSGMYENYFLDYASYVILERAVPSIEDGMKPVQRRILHAMKEMDDGRYHKVANIIGQTMQYHPHGDAAIGDALVNLGQKNLLIDCQGNWGDNRTGDRAAAARYIEARLTKFALDIAFNKQTTEWQLSYDGRKNEPINLPMKFPILLAQGVEGIAVGLSTKILPHNFIELIKASISILKGRNPKILPDFQNGGIMDAENYNEGRRGGKVRVRAAMEQVDNKTLAIRELPYGVTTTNLIDSIIKANDKGKIKIKKVVDNTAKEVEILVELPTGVSPDLSIDALYAFTNCEVSISPNACVIIEDKPHFMSVNEILKINTENTKELLRLELEIKKAELNEKWHFASLEKVFIENRIYRDIEECETWEAVIKAIDKGLQKYVQTPSAKKKDKKKIQLLREITEEDIVRLTEIKIKRISKYNTFKADELIKNLEEELAQVKHDLIHLTEFAIAYFDMLLKKYGKGKERKTKITNFETIQATQVVANNRKLYVNKAEGFIGYGLKKDEYISDCSDISDIIVFRKDGKFMVSRVSEKTFVGKNIIHAAVWKKGDERTTYNLIYLDGKTGRSFVKRFNVKAITREKEYDLTKGNKLSKLLYFTHNPNGESEIVSVVLAQSSKARIKVFDFDFSELEIKGRGAGGNILSKYPVKKVTQKEVGKSTLGAQKIWIDEVSGRLNSQSRGKFLGDFDTGDLILAIYKDGSYILTDYEMTNRYDVPNLLGVKKFDPDIVISAIYYDGIKKATYVKRFNIDTKKIGQAFNYLSDSPQTKLMFASLKDSPTISYKMRINSKTLIGELNLKSFIDVKSWKAQGNKFSSHKLTAVKEAVSDKLSVGSQIELDVKKAKKK